MEAPQLDTVFSRAQKNITKKQHRNFGLLNSLIMFPLYEYIPFKVYIDNRCNIYTSTGERRNLARLKLVQTSQLACLKLERLNLVL